MGKKYIIELLDKCNSTFKGIMAFGLTQEKQISVELIPEESMRPYTEPDLDQVRKEAYKDGYDAGFGRKIDASYQEGLSDAWEAARKIAYMYSEERKKVFGENLIRKIQDIYSASEAIEKLKAYEQEKEEQIQVGDEVTIRDKTAVVTEVTDRYVRIMYSGGSCYALFSEGLTKTGRHFPEIAEVLAKMKEADNG